MSVQESQPQPPVSGVPNAARLSWTHEIGLLLSGAVVYFGGRVVVEGSESDAISNANRLLDIEQTLGIDIESRFQQFALDNDLIRILGNLSYVWLHWPLLIAVLWVLFRTDARHYLQVRNALFLSGAIGLVLFTTLPMSPPRFLPGFVGTVSDEARRHYLSYPLSWTNRFAAFPSFHVGWTLIACLALASTARTKVGRALILTPAGLVGLAVVSTGNHYVLDTVAGVLIAVGAYLWFGRAARRQRDHSAADKPSSPADLDSSEAATGCSREPAVAHLRRDCDTTNGSRPSRPNEQQRAGSTRSASR